MKAAAKAAWLSALRVGLYCEGDDPSRLRDHTGFNALGVLADLLCPGGWERHGRVYSMFNCYSIPPEEVCELAGLGESHGWDVACLESFGEAIGYIEGKL